MTAPVTSSPAVTRPAPRRSALVLHGLVSGLLGAALLGLAVLGHAPLLAGVVVLQALSALAFLALVDAPASGGIFLLGTAAAIAADVVVEVDRGSVGGLAGVVALGLVGGLFHQLVRRDRVRVTESLADTLVVVVLVCCAACLPAALLHTAGTWPLRGGLAAAAAALLAGRLSDAVVARPALTLGASRAWPGLLLCLGVGALVSALVAGGHLSSGRAALVGLASAACVAAVDLALDLAGAELTPANDDARRVAALRPVSVVLPYVLLGPVLLLAVVLLSRA